MASSFFGPEVTQDRAIGTKFLLFITDRLSGNAYLNTVTATPHGVFVSDAERLDTVTERDHGLKSLNPTTKCHMPATELPCIWNRSDRHHLCVSGGLCSVSRSNTTIFGKSWMQVR